MKVIFANQELPKPERGLIIPNSIFLVGPTPRDSHTKSWRPEALDILNKKNFDGYVFVPEDDQWGFQGNYDNQVKWEIEGLGRSACIAAWVARRIPHMAAFTTNYEFIMGLLARTERFVVGFPDDAEKVSYPKWLGQNLDFVFESFFGSKAPIQSIPTTNNLDDLMEKAIQIARSPNIPSFYGDGGTRRAVGQALNLLERFAQSGHHVSVLNPDTFKGDRS